MKIHGILTGILAFVLFVGFVSPAFADVSEMGEITNEQNIPFGNPDERQEIVFPQAAVNLVTNGDFETGNFDGWTQFLTADGITNPAVVLFDTDGDTVATLSAQFDVGDTATPLTLEGGGISQIISTAGGSITLAADIAVLDQEGSDNAAGGIFELFFDGALVDSHDFGPVALNVAERATLSAILNGVAPGNHEIKIQMTRPFLTGFGSPEQYIDNVMAVGEPISAVGGEIIPLDTTMVLVAGTHSVAAWMIPVIVSGIGFAIVIARKF